MDLYSTDTKLRLFPYGNDLKAWFSMSNASSASIPCQNLERARRVRQDQDWRGRHDG